MKIIEMILNLMSKDFAKRLFYKLGKYRVEKEKEEIKDEIIQDIETAAQAIYKNSFIIPKKKKADDAENR